MMALAAEWLCERVEIMSMYISDLILSISHGLILAVVAETIHIVWVSFRKA